MLVVNTASHSQGFTAVSSVCDGRSWWPQNSGGGGLQRTRNSGRVGVCESCVLFVKERACLIQNPTKRGKHCSESALFEAARQRTLVLPEQGKGTSRRRKRWDSPVPAGCSQPAMTAHKAVLAEPKLAAMRKGSKR